MASRQSPAGERTLIRAPNHLGDLIMSLPALEVLPAADVLAARSVAALLAMVPRSGEVLAMDREDVIGTARRLRGRGYRRGIVMPPSFSSAAMLALAGIPHRRGVPTNLRGWLLTDRVPAKPGALHRASLYWWLVAGSLPPEPPVPRIEPDADARARWDAVSGGLGAGAIGLFPGSAASSRRWPVERFAELAVRMGGHAPVVVVGGPGERETGERIVALTAAHPPLNAAGRTDVASLAAGLSTLRVLVTNDSGPMHLAAAVGTPTIALFGAGNPVVAHPVGRGHRVIQHRELPCVPCQKNVCPRSGPGYVLPRAEKECMYIISVEEVAAAAESYLSAP